MTTLITTTAAIDDPNLLGGGLPAITGQPGALSCVRAGGLSLCDDQRQAFIAVAEREPTAGRVREFWAIVGRRGGAAAAIDDYQAHLRPGGADSEGSGGCASAAPVDLSSVSGKGEFPSRTPKQNPIDEGVSLIRRNGKIVIFKRYKGLQRLNPRPQFRG